MAHDPKGEGLVYETAMREALSEARRAADTGEYPYGAVVCTGDGTIIARARDMIADLGDPTRHGEFEAVRLAIEARGPDLDGCVLVSNVEPCCMCSAAAWYAGISTVVFGLTMAEVKALCPSALEEPLGPVDEIYAQRSRQIKAVSGVLHEDCVSVWSAFTGR